MTALFLRFWNELPTTARYASFLFIFVVVSYTLVGLYIGSIDRLNTDPTKVYDYPVALVDSQIYAEYGQRLAETGIYSDSKAPPYEKATSWPIGYPALLAVSWKLFGSFTPLIALQILLAGFAAVLMFLMTQRFVPEKIALIPAIVFGLDPSIAYYTGVVFTDGLFMSLLVIIVYGLFFLPEQHRYWSMFLLLGLLLGFSSLLRTIGQYLVLGLPILYVLYAYTQGWSVRKALFSMLIFIVGAVAVIYPAMERNYEVIGRHKLGTIGDKMLMQYYVANWLIVRSDPEADDNFTNTTLAENIKDELLAEAEQLATAHNSKPEAYNDKVAIQKILEDPVSYLRYHLTGSLPYFLAGSYRHYLASILRLYQQNAGLPYLEHTNIAHLMTAALFSGDVGQILMAVKSLSFVLIEVCWRLLIVGLALLSVLLINKKDRWLMLVFWALIGYFWFLTGPSAMTRYRIVTEPYLLPMATIGGWLLYTWLRTLYEKHRVTIETYINPKQFLKYFVVVLTGLTIDFTLLYLLTAHTDLWYFYAAAISFVAALLCNYVLASRWVFTDSSRKRNVQNFSLFLGVSLANLTLNQILMFGYVDLLGLAVLFAKTLTLPFTFIFNYLITKRFVFKS